MVKGKGNRAGKPASPESQAASYRNTVTGSRLGPWAGVSSFLAVWTPPLVLVAEVLLPLRRPGEESPLMVKVPRVPSGDRPGRTPSDHPGGTGGGGIGAWHPQTHGGLLPSGTAGPQPSHSPSTSRGTNLSSPANEHAQPLSSGDICG